jgi:hypothetical protein
LVNNCLMHIGFEDQSRHLHAVRSEHRTILPGEGSAPFASISQWISLHLQEVEFKSFRGCSI